MSDDLDALFHTADHAPPDGFVDRVTMLAKGLEQCRPTAGGLKPWQWASLGAGAGMGAALLSEFVFFALIPMGAM